MARRRIAKRNPDFAVLIDRSTPAGGIVMPNGTVAIVLRSGARAPLSGTDSQELLSRGRVRSRSGSWKGSSIERVRVRPNGLFGFGGKSKPAEVYDLNTYIAKASTLGKQAHWKLIESMDEEPADDEVHYLVHAPGKGGQGKAWYFLDYVTPRSFDSASPYTVPVRYITAADPSSQLRINLGQYRWPDGHFVIMVDTFTGETAITPATQIVGRKAAANPKGGYVRAKIRASKRKGRR
jgi:hypothetical protein